MVLPSPVTVPLATGLSLAPATELLTLLRTRQVSAVELLEAVVRRADAVTAAVNPFAMRLDERAFAPPPSRTAGSPTAPRGPWRGCR